MPFPQPCFQSGAHAIPAASKYPLDLMGCFWTPEPIPKVRWSPETGQDTYFRVWDERLSQGSPQSLPGPLQALTKLFIAGTPRWEGELAECLGFYQSNGHPENPIPSLRGHARPTGEV